MTVRTRAGCRTRSTFSCTSESLYFHVGSQWSRDRRQGRHPPYNGPKAGNAPKALISPLLALGLLMGTGGCCLYLLGYKAFKRSVPALCSGWRQNPPDLPVSTQRCHLLLWEKLRPFLQPHRRCHELRQDIWGNLADHWSFATPARPVNNRSR